MRVPRQRTTIGKAGYIGHVEVYDAKLPHVRFVQPEEPSNGHVEPTGLAESEAARDAAVEPFIQAREPGVAPDGAGDGAPSSAATPKRKKKAQ